MRLKQQWPTKARESCSKISKQFNITGRVENVRTNRHGVLAFAGREHGVKQIDSRQNMSREKPQDGLP